MTPQNLDAAYPRNVLEVRYWTPSVKYFGREIFGGCTPTKYLTEPHP